MPTRQLSFPQPPESALNHTIVTTHKCFSVNLSPVFEFRSLRKLGLTLKTSAYDCPSRCMDWKAAKPQILSRNLSLQCLGHVKGRQTDTSCHFISYRVVIPANATMCPGCMSKWVKWVKILAESTILHQRNTPLMTALQSNFCLRMCAWFWKYLPFLAYLISSFYRTIQKDHQQFTKGVRRIK